MYMQDSLIVNTSISDSMKPFTHCGRAGDTSVDVHSAEASAPAEQHTGEAAAPSQQTQAQDLFGASVLSTCNRLLQTLIQYILYR